MTPLVGALTGGCTVVWQTVVAEEVRPGQDPITITTPVRAYLADGSIVVLPQGARVASGELRGNGARFPLELNTQRRFSSVTLDSVVAMEAFRSGYERQAETVLLAAASVPVAVFGTMALMVAIFGSCPTIYADIQGETVLQAEPFSYSISALFEARDVDRLSALPDAASSNDGPSNDAPSTDALGVLRLELRNEAMETHYINHMEVLEVDHRPDEEVIPDPLGRPLVLRDLRAPLAAMDRDGRSVLAEVTSKDELAFRSSPARLAAATEADFSDHIELEVPVDPGQSEIALVLRYRNTLLNTVLFYDVMLGESGLRALDWLGTDLHRIGTAVELARWYQDRMGMRVEVEHSGVFHQVEHLPDAGPIAWTERAVVIPVTGPRARVRLSFPSDSWFIDQVAVAELVGTGEARRIPVARVVDAQGLPAPEVPALLAAPDEEYLVTFPGQRMHLEFDVPESQDGQARTFLLATQGYYVEWLRGPWLKADSEAGPFRPEDGAILRAMHRWAQVMDDYERDFHASRIPVR